MDPDRELVQAAAAGSRDAFDELVRRHQVAIVGFVRVLLSGRGEAEDLARFDAETRELHQAVRAVLRQDQQPLFDTFLERRGPRGRGGRGGPR